jgi:hypothetical protein
VQSHLKHGRRFVPNKDRKASFDVVRAGFRQHKTITMKNEWCVCKEALHPTLRWIEALEFKVKIRIGQTVG